MRRPRRGGPVSVSEANAAALLAALRDGKAVNAELLFEREAPREFGRVVPRSVDARNGGHSAEMRAREAPPRVIVRDDAPHPEEVAEASRAVWVSVWETLAAMAAVARRVGTGDAEELSDALSVVDLHRGETQLARDALQSLLSRTGDPYARAYELSTLAGRVCADARALSFAAERGA